ncbi:CTP synthase [Spironucleus salmonicida]|nr:CTP synthase [Spironucleus salmonicida]
MHGFSVRNQKFDPYFNVDPGTMSPYQHGEVYVLDDGAETDLDLGHYERFTHGEFNRTNSISSGQIYLNVIQNERQGKYLGATVQTIPHITDEIKRNVKFGSENCDIVITELGGTVGDIEGLPYLEAFRQFQFEVGRENCIFIHLTYVPYLKAAGEVKTKPSQMSVAKLRELGMTPDVLVTRSEVAIGEENKKKLAFYCNVDSIIEEVDLENSIYEIPIYLQNQALDIIVLQKLKLFTGKPLDMTNWKNTIQSLISPSKTVKIGFVGKYLENSDAYKSVFESLTHAGIANDTKVEIVKIDSESLTPETVATALESVSGVLVPGGFGERGVAGMILACQFCRENDVPYFGICLGMQIAIIEFARNVLGLENANSEEFDTESIKVISLMACQKKIETVGGSMRLGAYKCKLLPGSYARAIYGEDEVSERHRHRFEVNSEFEAKLVENGLKIVGKNEETGLAEIVEIEGLRFFVAVQFHPEFKSKVMQPHKVFTEFVKKCAE